MNSKKFTLMVIPDVNRSIVRARVPTYWLYLLPSILLFIVLAVIVMLYLAKLSYVNEIITLHDQLSSQKVKAERIIDNKENTIEQLQTDIVKLHQDSQDMKAKIDALYELEQKVRRMSKLPPISDASPTGKMGQGGETVPVSNDKINELAEATFVSLDELSLRVTLINERLVNAQLELEKLDAKERHTPNYWPASGERMTSSFGVRKDPFTGKAAMHKGIDISGDVGDRVFAAAEGKVVERGTHRAKGNYIVIEHSRSLRTVYMHLNAFKVKRGEHVKKGQWIGELGSTGRSTAPHLHFEVHKNGIAVNPKRYLFPED